MINLGCFEKDCGEEGGLPALQQRANKKIRGFGYNLNASCLNSENGGEEGIGS